MSSSSTRNASRSSPSSLLWFQIPLRLSVTGLNVNLSIDLLIEGGNAILIDPNIRNLHETFLSCSFITSIIFLLFNLLRDGISNL